MRTITYTRSSVGKDPRNPLIDIHPDDELFYFETLVEWLGEISTQAQQKPDFVWDELIKRRPKQLSKGQTGPNSVFSTVSGLLYNYVNNNKRVGVCRISLRQTEDITLISQIMHCVRDDLPEIQFREALFNQKGVEF